MSTPESIIVGTRRSQLARWQTDHVLLLLQAAWPELTCQVKSFSTQGDRILDQPLPAIGGKGLFTAALEQALLEGQIDIAVHSLKDLPVADPPGLVTGAILSRADVRDVLVSREGYTVASLPPGAIVGTSSPRRQAQLLAVRPDVHVRSIRGNVETRIAKVLDGHYDATILAAAGIARLGLNDHLQIELPLSTMLPAPGQGALAVQCRADDKRVLDLLAAIHDQDVRDAVTAERAFLQALGGGCAVPVAAYAHADGAAWHLQGLVADPAGAPVVRVASSGTDPLRLGQTLAEQAVLAGAGRILDRLRPLRGRRIVITRSADLAGAFADQLAALGAEPVIFPVITFVATEARLLEPYLAALGEFDWLVFTSGNAVRYFFDAYDALDKGPTLPSIAAVGQATAELLAERGIQADFLPKVFSGEALAAGLGDLGGRRVLLPRALGGRPETVAALQAQGAEVVDVPLYETVTAEPEPQALAEITRGVDVITFTSPSSVRNFRRLMLDAGIDCDALFTASQLVCIGPSTAAQLEAYGHKADLIPSTYTVDGMIAAMIDKEY